MPAPGSAPVKQPSALWNVTGRPSSPSPLRPASHTRTWSALRATPEPLSFSALETAAAACRRKLSPQVPSLEDVVSATTLYNVDLAGADGASSLHSSETAHAIHVTVNEQPNSGLSRNVSIAVSVSFAESSPQNAASVEQTCTWQDDWSQDSSLSAPSPAPPEAASPRLFCSAKSAPIDPCPNPVNAVVPSLEHRSAFSDATPSITTHVSTYTTSSDEVSSGDWQRHKVRFPSSTENGSDEHGGNSKPADAGVRQYSHRSSPKECNRRLAETPKGLQVARWISGAGVSAHMTLGTALVLVSANRTTYFLFAVHLVMAFTFLMGSLSWQSNPQIVRVAFHQVTRYMMSGAALALGGAVGSSALAFIDTIQRKNVYALQECIDTFVGCVETIWAYQPVPQAALSVVWLLISLILCHRLKKTGEPLEISFIRLTIVAALFAASLALTIVTLFGAIGIIVVGVLGSTVTFAPVVSSWWCSHLAARPLPIQLALLGVIILGILIDAFFGVSSKVALWCSVCFPLAHLLIASISTSQGRYLLQVEDLFDRSTPSKLIERFVSSRQRVDQPSSGSCTSVSRR